VGPQHASYSTDAWADCTSASRSGRPGWVGLHEGLDRRRVKGGFPLAGARPIMLGDRAGRMTGFIDHFPGLMKVHCGWLLFMNVNEQKEVQAEPARKGRESSSTASS